MGTGQNHARNGFTTVLVLLLGAMVAGVALLIGSRPAVEQADPQADYPWHSGIKTTVFWVGENADKSNDFIHNRSSVWIYDWVAAYGGVDDPEDRCDSYPCGFTPKENPFYAALPYNDLDSNCRPKSTQSSIYWFEGKSHMGKSLIKNRWIQIRIGDKTVYAQVEDSGPFGEDDVDYVFGDHPPSEKRSGLDLSPAAAQYLGVDGSDGQGQVAWRFVKQETVPDGPWRQIITKSNPDC